MPDEALYILATLGVSWALIAVSKWRSLQQARREDPYLQKASAPDFNRKALRLALLWFLPDRYVFPVRYRWEATKASMFDEASQLWGNDHV